MWPLLGALSAIHMIDVPIRRARAAQRAKAYARAVGKPMINVGAGPATSALFGDITYGDINVDMLGRRDVPHGTPGVVTYANAEDLPFATGSMGSLLASHVLEHMPDPARALREWRRVTGGDPNALFVVTPSWWGPHTWLHPGHLWYFPDGEGCQSGQCRPRPLPNKQLGAEWGWKIFR